MAKRNKKSDADKGPRSKEGATGTPEAPKNVPIPEEARIKRNPAPATAGQESTTGPKVVGNQRLVIMDVLQNTAVEVIVLEGKHLNPENSGKLVFIQGTVSNELLPEAQARSRFAVKKDGTVIYNPRGFDDVPQADFDMVDIVKLVELNEKDA